MFYIERLIGFWIKVIEIEEDRRVVVQRCGVWLLKATVCGFDSCESGYFILILSAPATRQNAALVSATQGL